MPLSSDDRKFLKGIYQELTDKPLDPGDPRYEPVYCLGVIAMREFDLVGARRLLVQALALFERIGEPYSVGQAHQQLARLAEDQTERMRHIHAARPRGRESIAPTWSRS